jgi:hypothetical protein
VKCPQTWQAVVTGCSIRASDPETGVVERRARTATTGDDVTWEDSTGIPLAEGVHELVARAVNGVGRSSPWVNADHPLQLDLTPPGAAIHCDRVHGATHSCVATGTDEGSGIADLRLVREGALAGALEAGKPFTVNGPTHVAAVATDHVGRTTSSEALALPGHPEQAPDDAVDAGQQRPPAARPADPDSGRPSAQAEPALPPSAVGRGAADQHGAAAPRPFAVSPSDELLAPVTIRLRTIRGRRVGRATIRVLRSASGERRVLVDFRPPRLAAGTWRLTACVKRGKCARRTVLLRRAGRPRALRKQLAAPAEGARVKFTIARAIRGRYRQFAAGGALATF